MTKSRIESYINQFNQLFNGDPWLDETFAKKLDSLTSEQAFIQAPGNNHSVAEVVSHVIEWRKEVIRRLAENSSERRLTGESGENWKSLEQLQRIGWQQLYSNLKQTQQELVNLLETKGDHFLDEQLADTEFDKEYFLAGILHHDLYHLGQIGLILKWAK